MHLTLAFKQAFRVGAKPVSVGIVDEVLSRAIDEFEPTRNAFLPALIG